MEKAKIDGFYRARNSFQDVAQDPNTPSDYLNFLSRFYLISVKELVAANPSTPACALEKLSKDISSSVRSGVAVNPNTPCHVLWELRQDDFLEVRDSVEKNPQVIQQRKLQKWSDELDKKHNINIKKMTEEETDHTVA